MVSRCYLSAPSRARKWRRCRPSRPRKEVRHTWGGKLCAGGSGEGLQGKADEERLTLKTDPNPKYLLVALPGKGGP